MGTGETDVNPTEAALQGLTTESGAGHRHALTKVSSQSFQWGENPEGQGI